MSIVVSEKQNRNHLGWKKQQIILNDTRAWTSDNGLGKSRLAAAGLGKSRQVWLDTADGSLDGRLVQIREPMIGNYAFGTLCEGK